jgi:ribonuclease HI
MKCYLDAVGNKVNKKEYGAYGITFFDDKGQKINEYFSEDKDTTYIKENFKGIVFLMKKYGTKNFKNIITVYCDSGVTVQTFTNWIHKWHKFNWTKVDGTPP